MNGMVYGPPKRPWLRGSARGLVGAMAMSGMRQFTVGMGAVERTPPDAVLREGFPSLLRCVPAHRRMAAIELAHWGYGAMAGAVFALIPRGVRRWRISGPVYGVLVWGAFELLVAPVLGLAHASRDHERERCALLVDHAFFGLIVGTPHEASLVGEEEPVRKDGSGQEAD